MTTRPLDRDDPLDDFDRRMIRLLGTDRLVYVTGGGPAVIVMTEMPGISPHVARFARWVSDALGGVAIVDNLYVPGRLSRPAASRPRAGHAWDGRGERVFLFFWGRS